MLGRFNDGLELIDKMSFSSLERQHRLFLKAAYTYESGSRDLAQKILGVLKGQNLEALPLEVQLLDLTTSLHVKDRRNVKNVTLRTCRKYDGISCWAQLAHYYWEDLGLVSKREGPVLPAEAVNQAVSSLTTPGGINPMDEKVYIDQKDIEELDGRFFDEILKKRELD